MKRKMMNGFLPALEGAFVETEFHTGAAGGCPFLFSDVGGHLESRNHFVGPRSLSAQFTSAGQTNLLRVNCVNWKLRFGQCI